MKLSKGKYEGWWDWTGLAMEEPEFMDRVRKLTLADLAGLSNDRFTVRIYPNREQFFMAEALEYVTAWQKATADNPVAVCGPVGPVEQLPLVASLINELGVDVRHGIFAGMDEFVVDGKAVPRDHPLSFARTDMEMCFSRIESRLRMPDNQLIFPTENLAAYTAAWNDSGIRWELTQGGQGNTKHVAFDDPLPALGEYADRPPTPDEYAALPTRMVKLHPVTIVQDARHSTAGDESVIPADAITVGLAEILNRSECVSIWHPGHHDNPFGIRLTAYMISLGLQDGRVPMSLLARHHNVRFNLLGPCIASAEWEMH